MTDMYENYLKKYAFQDNSPAGGVTGYDKVKSAMAGVAKIEGALVSIGTEKTAKTVTFTVYFGKRPVGEVVKRDIPPTDAMAFLANIKGDRNAVTIRSANVKRSMTEESVRDAYHAVLLQVALVLGGQDKVAEAERELHSYIAQAVDEEKHFSADTLTSIASHFFPDQDTGKPKKKSDVTSQDRMRTLNAMKTMPTNANLVRATKAAGFPEEVIKEAAKYFFVQSKREKNGEVEDVYSLRKSEKGAAPSYKDDKSNVSMRLSSDRLYFVDPRNPDDKPATSKAAASGAVIRASRGAVARGEDKEYEGAVQHLLTKGYSQAVIDSLTHKLVKETAKSAGYNYAVLQE